MTALPAPGTQIGRGLRAEVFAAGPGAVVKLFQAGVRSESVFGEAARQAAATAAGAPVPVVLGVAMHGRRWGIWMERCDGPSLAGRMRSEGADVVTLLAEMATLHRGLHRLDGSRLPSQSARLQRDIARAVELTETERREFLAELEKLGAGPDRLCHGDFHPMNVLGAPGACVIIDWADGCCGSPELDVARSLVLMRQVSMELAEGYLATYSLGDPASTDRIRRWLPLVAAARLAEGIAGEREHLIGLVRGDLR